MVHWFVFVISYHQQQKYLIHNCRHTTYAGIMHTKYAQNCFNMRIVSSIYDAAHLLEALLLTKHVFF